MTVDKASWIKRDLTYNLDTQRVYVGSNARIYVIAQTDNPTGCWAILNGDGGHPIPTESIGGTFEASGYTIDLQLQDTNPHPLRSIFWIGKETGYPNIYAGTPGVNLVKLAPHSSQQVYARTTDRVFRFTGAETPTGLWVVTDAAKDPQPIPTAPTCIDVEGKTLTVVSKADDERQVLWLDVTPP